MPRKKKVQQEETEETKQNDSSANGGRIVNMYNKIPSHFIDKVNNPNFNLHHMKIPFRICVVAPSGSGKTNFLLNLIEVFSRGDDGTFQTITILTKNADEPLYRWLSSVSDQIMIKEGLSNIPKLDKFDKEQNNLVVFDDLVLEKDLSAVSQYYIRARKLNVSVIFLSQSFFMIPKIIRNNCNYMVLLKLSGNREVNMILSEYGLGVTKEQLIDIYEYCTREKMQPLIIDLEAEPTQRFRKGFLQIVDPNNIPN
jgi:hypothetical protein